MRLKPDEVAAIKAAAAAAFGDCVVVRLFGSRVDDSKRGGDIDLHVEVDGFDPAREREMRFRALLADLLDEEPVDVVVRSRDATPRWIDRAAMRDGQTL